MRFQETLTLLLEINCLYIDTLLIRLPAQPDAVSFPTHDRRLQYAGLQIAADFIRGDMGLGEAHVT